MTIKEGTDIGRRTIIKSGEGQSVNYVKEFNTETKEAVCYSITVYSNNTKNLQ